MILANSGFELLQHDSYVVHSDTQARSSMSGHFLCWGPKGILRGKRVCWSVGKWQLELRVNLEKASTP